MKIKNAVTSGREIKQNCCPLSPYNSNGSSLSGPVILLIITTALLFYQEEKDVIYTRCRDIAMNIMKPELGQQTAP